LAFGTFGSANITPGQWLRGTGTVPNVRETAFSAKAGHLERDDPRTNTLGTFNPFIPKAIILGFSHGLARHQLIEYTLGVNNAAAGLTVSVDWILSVAGELARRVYSVLDF